MTPLPVFGSPGPVLLLLAALAIDANVGCLTSFLPPGPRTLVGRLGTLLDRKLNRRERGDTARLFRGALIVLVIAPTASLAGWLLHWACLILPYGWSLELLLLLCCIQLREPWQRIRRLRHSLERQDLATARVEVGALTRRNPETLDAYAVARAAIEAAARSLNQGVVTPAFWYILLGLPGVLLWTAVNALDESFGRHSPRYEYFGMITARVDDVLNFLPARLCGALIACAAAFLGSAMPLKALRTMIRDARYHKSLNTGWPEASMAGALGLALGGPYQAGDVTVREIWIGQGRARATPADIGRALALHRVACLVLAGLLAVLLLGLAAL
ncbi:MAG: CobD/CbiB family cobalamin biosynthesis protein [Rhodospirillaceae bacterium]